MSDVPLAAAVRGKTIRFIWLEGPTKGKTHEHIFHPDGTVEWHDAGKQGGDTGTKAPERVPYSAVEAAADVYLASYLAQSGYTLTVVLDFKTGKLVGVASGGTTWAPVGGRFEVAS